MLSISHSLGLISESTKRGRNRRNNNRILSNYSSNHQCTTNRRIVALLCYVRTGLLLQQRHILFTSGILLLFLYLFPYLFLYLRRRRCQCSLLLIVLLQVYNCSWWCWWNNYKRHLLRDSLRATDYNSNKSILSIPGDTWFRMKTKRMAIPLFFSPHFSKPVQVNYIKSELHWVSLVHVFIVSFIPILRLLFSPSVIVTLGPITYRESVSQPFPVVF